MPNYRIPALCEVSMELLKEIIGWICAIAMLALIAIAFFPLFVIIAVLCLGYIIGDYGRK